MVVDYPQKKSSGENIVVFTKKESQKASNQKGTSNYSFLSTTKQKNIVTLIIFILPELSSAKNFSDRLYRLRDV